MARSFMKIAEDMVTLQAKKNNDYDNAFAKSMDKYGMVVGLIRIGDKINRLEGLYRNKTAQVRDESIVDTLTDLAAYSLMMIEWIENNDERTDH